MPPFEKSIFRTQFKLSILLLTILSVSTVVSSLSSYASQDNPYQSGYDHGCDDAGISDSSERYINQPEKGPSFHTNAFMNGYYDGFDACSSRNVDDGNGGNSDEDNVNNNRPQETRNEGRGPWDEGYAQGRTDLLNGNPKNSYCDPNNTAPNPDAYCATYKAGYEAGWLAAELLYGNQQPR